MDGVRRALLAAVLALVTACGHHDSSAQPSTVVVFHTSQLTARTARLPIAETDAQKAKGLMGVTHLAPDAGMVFLWTQPTTARFWMKDTLIPLSIAFIDAGDRVVDLRDMRPCRSDSCNQYGARAPYTIAIEMNLGWFENHGVQRGDRVELRNG